MRITKLFMALLILVPFLQSCQADIEDLADPRNAIAKQWSVVDNTVTGANGYWVVISKDANDKTKIILNNFHNLGDDINVSATMANYNITIPSQSVPGGYTLEGSGEIANDQKTIRFECDETTVDGTVTIVSEFGKQIVKKKTGILIVRP